jgi:hypothetical protein
LNIPAIIKTISLAMTILNTDPRDTLYWKLHNIMPVYNNRLTNEDLTKRITGTIA